jgi:hypothetical protein
MPSPTAFIHKSGARPLPRGNPGGGPISLCRVAHTLCLLILLASPLSAQSRMNGRVLVGDDGLSDGMVVLHSVSPNVAGEVDSVRVDAQGRFDFMLPAGLDDEDRTQIYFASVRHQGVLYFGEAIALTPQLDSLYLIEVFDAEVAPDEGLALPLAVRNIVMEPDGDGWLATDLLQILNDRDRTIVASEGGVVWSHALPPSALDVEVGRGELPEEAVDFDGGRVIITAPLPPGERLLLIRYRLPGLPAEIPMDFPTAVMELLVKEPALPVEASPLQAVQAVAIEANSYRRYTGQNLLPGAPILIEEAEVPAVFPLGWMAVLFTMLLTVAGLFVYYRPVTTVGSPGLAITASGAAGTAEGPLTGQAAAGPSSHAPDSADRGAVIVEIARLDQDVADLGENADEARSELLARRAELMDRLRAQS